MMGDTTMLDIYEAAGWKVNQDRTAVYTDGTLPNKAFEIVLKVVPIGVQMGEGPDKVTFAIILDEETVIEQGLLGTTLHRLAYDEEITLPVNQVNIKKD